MPHLRVLHLSDLHITRKDRFIRRLARRPAAQPEILKALAESIYDNRNEIDGIIISGDLADIGWHHDLNPALDFIDSPGNSYSDQPWLNSHRLPTLQSCGKPIIIVPGNHDRFVNYSGKPGSEFDIFFSSFWTTGLGGVQEYFLPDSARPLLAIICADFSLERVIDCSVLRGHWGQGKVYQNRLIKLTEKTNLINSLHPSIAVIWVIHFAPKFENYHDFDEACL